MTRDEFIDRLLEKGHTVLDDHVDAIVDAFEVAGLLDSLDDTIDPVELDAATARLDARMEATGLIRPLEERVYDALGSILDFLGVKLAHNRLEACARDVIRLANLREPIEGIGPLCNVFSDDGHCNKPKCHPGPHAVLNGFLEPISTWPDGEPAPAPPPSEAWGEREAKRLHLAWSNRNESDHERHWRYPNIQAEWLAAARKAWEIAAERERGEVACLLAERSQVANQRDAARADLARVTRENADMKGQIISMALDLAAKTADLATTQKDYAKACVDLANVKAECERLQDALALNGFSDDCLLLAEKKLAAARAKGFEAGRDAAAHLLSFPAMVFAFETEDIRADVIQRIRALRPPSEPQGGEGQ